jgi:uncharacterized protein YecE (DUF72 family)
MIDSSIRIGTAGFSYKDWLGNFYPQFCPVADFLRFYSSKFTTVELDVTFYRIPSEKVVTKWAASTPADFKFAAKFPRTVTHEGTLANRLEQAEQFISVIRGLKEKLGPLLLQFPYSFKPDSCDILKALVEAMPKDLQVSVELRNRSWLGEDLYGWFRKHSIALCLVDHPWMPRLSVRTADFQYVRFLGDQRSLTEDFSYIRIERAEELQWWADLILEFSNDSGEIYAYFNNHYSGHAPTTAQRLLEALADR